MIRQALMQDAKQIQELVNTFAKQGEMLLLSLNEIYEKIFEFLVWEEDGELLGCCALHPSWVDLAEIRSLAVSEKAHGKGVGRELVNKQIERARSLGFQKVFALTYVQDFFGRLGFHELEKENLPKKIWSDCLKCAKFPDCDEIAVIKDL